MKTRLRIERSARLMGLNLSRLEYERPVSFEMGDGYGGWTATTDSGYAFNGLNAAWIIGEMEEYAKRHNVGAQS